VLYLLIQSISRRLALNNNSSLFTALTRVLDRGGGQTATAVRYQGSHYDRSRANPPMEHQLGKVAEGPSEKYRLIKREIEEKNAG
jgi:hypothetical protein